MLNFKKVYIFKVISIVVCITFLSTTTLYPSPISKDNTLRVPSSFQKKEYEKRIVPDSNSKTIRHGGESTGIKVPKEDDFEEIDNKKAEEYIATFKRTWHSNRLLYRLENAYNKYRESVIYMLEDRLIVLTVGAFVILSLTLLAVAFLDLNLTDIRKVLLLLKENHILTILAITLIPYFAYPVLLSVPRVVLKFLDSSIPQDFLKSFINSDKPLSYFLSDILENGSYEAREYAIEVCADVKNRRAIPQLLYTILLHDKNLAQAARKAIDKIDPYELAKWQKKDGSFNFQQIAEAVIKQKLQAKGIVAKEKTIQEASSMVGDFLKKGIKIEVIYIKPEQQGPLKIEESIEIEVVFPPRGKVEEKRFSIHNIRPGWTFKGWRHSKRAVMEKFKTDEEKKEALQYILVLARRIVNRKDEDLSEEHALKDCIPAVIKIVKNTAELKDICDYLANLKVVAYDEGYSFAFIAIGRMCKMVHNIRQLKTICNYFTAFDYEPPYNFTSYLPRNKDEFPLFINLIKTMVNNRVGSGLTLANIIKVEDAKQRKVFIDLAVKLAAKGIYSSDIFNYSNKENTLYMLKVTNNDLDKIILFVELANKIEGEKNKRFIPPFDILNYIMPALDKLAKNEKELRDICDYLITFKRKAGRDFLISTIPALSKLAKNEKELRDICDYLITFEMDLHKASPRIDYYRSRDILIRDIPLICSILKNTTQLKNICPYLLSMYVNSDKVYRGSITIDQNFIKSVKSVDNLILFLKLGVSLTEYEIEPSYVLNVLVPKAIALNKPKTKKDIEEIKDVILKLESKLVHTNGGRSRLIGDWGDEKGIPITEEIFSQAFVTNRKYGDFDIKYKYIPAEGYYEWVDCWPDSDRQEFVETAPEKHIIEILPSVRLSNFSSTVVLFLDTEVVVYPLHFENALAQLRRNKGNTPVILLTMETYDSINSKVKGINGVLFKAPAELGLHNFKWYEDKRVAKIAGTDDLACLPLDLYTDAFRSLPLTESLCEQFKDLRRARDSI